MDKGLLEMAEQRNASSIVDMLLDGSRRRPGEARRKDRSREPGAGRSMVAEGQRPVDLSFKLSNGGGKAPREKRFQNGHNLSLLNNSRLDGLSQSRL